MSPYQQGEADSFHASMPWNITAKPWRSGCYSAVQYNNVDMCGDKNQSITLRLFCYDNE